MCEHRLYTNNGTDISRKATEFYIDLEKFECFIKYNPYLPEKEAKEYTQREVENELINYILPHLKSSIRIKRTQDESGAGFRGTICLPYYNDNVIANKYETKYGLELIHKDIEIETIKEYKEKLEQKIRDYNSLPWWKRIWKKLE